MSPAPAISASISPSIAPFDNTEPTETLMLVEGSNVNFDGDGNFVGLLDANSIVLLIDYLVQTRGLEPARYIRPALPEYTAA